jgi:hypothetical protein
VSAERITPEEILTALKADSGYNQPEVLAQVEPYAHQLPIVLEGWLEQPITPEGFLEAKHYFITWLRENQYDDIRVIEGVLNNLVSLRIMQTTHPEVIVEVFDEPFEEVLLPHLKPLYRNGTLTFKGLIRFQPSILLP